MITELLQRDPVGGGLAEEDEAGADEGGGHVAHRVEEREAKPRAIGWAVQALVDERAAP